MKTLVALLENMGLSDIKTYIQSGNVVFRIHDNDPVELASQISAAISVQHAFTPRVMLLTPVDLDTAVNNNPYPEAEHEPKTLHLTFLESVPTSPDLASLEALKTKNERYKLIKKVLYLHAPEGIGRSKLAARIEPALGVAVTMRNWRTVNKIIELGGSIS